MTPGAQPQGYVLATHTSIGAAGVGDVADAYFVLAHQLIADFSLRALDLWPPLAVGRRYAAASWHSLQYCTNSSSAMTCGIKLFEAPLQSSGKILMLPRYANGTDPFAPTLAVIVPRCIDSGAAFFGETAKFATISVQRVLTLQCSKGGFSVTLIGLPGEVVEVKALVTGGGAVVAASAPFPGVKNDSSRSTLYCVLEGGLFSCA